VLVPYLHSQYRTTRYCTTQHPHGPGTVQLCYTALHDPVLLHS